MFETKEMRRARQSKQWKAMVRELRKECGALYERVAQREIAGLNVMEVTN